MIVHCENCNIRFEACAQFLRADMDQCGWKYSIVNKQTIYMCPNCDAKKSKSVNLLPTIPNDELIDMVNENIALATKNLNSAQRAMLLVTHIPNLKWSKLSKSFRDLDRIKKKLYEKYTIASWSTTKPPKNKITD